MHAETDLVRQGLPVVHAVSHKIARRLRGHVHIDDLLGLGNLALVEVARSWDPARAGFTTYAAPRVKWAILDGLRRESHARCVAARVLAVMASERFADAAERRREDEPPTTQEEDQAALGALLQGQAAALALGLLATPHDPTVAPAPPRTPEEELSAAQLGHAAVSAIQLLPEQQRALVERHYFDGDPFDEIADDLGISKSWASRLHEKAIHALSGAMRASTGRGPPAAPARSTCDRAP